ncbi:hypothetical protein NUW54_g14756 [Trametes sanguinea]|uniref:Uncharacterized protein n=1 Tax=Trametes sanguinea TaxID=158606 RepID=A0ACC1MBD2_9APHY|nr:hypothetical protein NUW54_g14756 [Trametes sanguinea]
MGRAPACEKCGGRVQRAQRDWRRRGRDSERERAAEGAVEWSRSVCLLSFFPFLSLRLLVPVSRSVLWRKTFSPSRDSKSSVPASCDRWVLGTPPLADVHVHALAQLSAWPVERLSPLHKRPSPSSAYASVYPSTSSARDSDHALSAWSMPALHAPVACSIARQSILDDDLVQPALIHAHPR